ncbi:unnamed protein product, partial [Polarella glacialis]
VQRASAEAMPSGDEQWLVVTSVSHDASLKASWVVNGRPSAPELPPKFSPRPRAVKVQTSALDVLATAERRASGKRPVGGCKRRKCSGPSRGHGAVSCPPQPARLVEPPFTIVEHHHVHRHMHRHHHQVLDGEEEAASFLGQVAPNVGRVDQLTQQKAQMSRSASSLPAIQQFGGNERCVSWASGSLLEVPGPKLSSSTSLPQLRDSGRGWNTPFAEGSQSSSPALRMTLPQLVPYGRS